MTSVRQVFTAMAVDPQDVIIFSTNFSSGVGSELKWLYEPEKTEVVPAGGRCKGGFKITLDEQHDYWQKTFYIPTLQKDDGHMLYLSSNEPFVVMETAFELHAMELFDQAGLMVRLDTEHWLKTGLEFVDGEYKLSCVVTNVHSDWSTQAWPCGALHVRIFRQNNDFVVEASSDGADWSVLRVCHLDVEPNQTLAMGLAACAPSGTGGSVVFEKLEIRKSEPHPWTTV